MEGLSFTTYLKICLLPSTQAKTGALQRMHGPGKGYDFYKRMKLAAQDVALGNLEPAIVLAQLANITRKAEREHNTFVATKFLEWWKVQLNDGCSAYDQRPAGAFARPNMPFEIRLKPELRFDDKGIDTVVYLWATANPRLTNQVAGTGILIMQEAFANTKFKDCEYKIFDLRRNRIMGSETITNATVTNLNADLAQIGSIWSQVS